MKRSDAYPSNFMSKDDASTPMTLLIADVRMEDVNVGDNQTEQKPVIHWREDAAPLILNQHNWMVCEDLYGDDSDAWVGQPIEVFVDPNVTFAGKRVGGVRLRPATGVVPPAAPAPAPAPAPVDQGGFGPPAAEPDDGGVVLLTWDMAVSMAGDAGATKEDLIAHLKGLGLAGYNAERDTAAVRSWLAMRGRGTHEPVPEADIPF